MCACARIIRGVTLASRAAMKCGQSGGGCTLRLVGETIIRWYRDVEKETRRSGLPG
jgi:hypothetical protein